MIRDIECECETVNKQTVVYKATIFPYIDNGNWSLIRSCSQEGLREPCPQRIPLHPRQNSWWNLLLEVLPTQDSHLQNEDNDGGQAADLLCPWTSSRNPTFAHYKWNLHDSTKMLLPRSSNIAEGWHHGFHSMIPCSHPTIWKFLDCLKNRAGPHRRKVDEETLQRSPGTKSCEVDYVRSATPNRCCSMRTMTCLILFKLLAVWFESKFIILYLCCIICCICGFNIILKFTLLSCF